MREQKRCKWSLCHMGKNEWFAKNLDHRNLCHLATSDCGTKHPTKDPKVNNTKEQWVNELMIKTYVYLRGSCLLSNLLQ